MAETADFKEIVTGTAIQASGGVSSFTGPLRNIGYPGAIPYPKS